MYILYCKVCIFHIFFNLLDMLAMDEAFQKLEPKNVNTSADTL